MKKRSDTAGGIQTADFGSLFRFLYNNSEENKKSIWEDCIFCEKGKRFRRRKVQV